MNRLLVVVVCAALFFAACTECVTTSDCAGGLACDASGRCSVDTRGGVVEVDGGTDAGGAGGGTATGGGNATGGGTAGGGGAPTGGGGPLDAGPVDAGPVDAGPAPDPLDDGGTFVPGDICAYAIQVDFGDGTTPPDGGTANHSQLYPDLSLAQDQYDSACSAHRGAKDLLFTFDLTAPHGLVVGAWGRAAPQQPILSLFKGPCSAPTQLACVETLPGSYQMTIDRLESGRYFVLLENSAGDDGPGIIDLRLTDPAPSPANDRCANAQPLMLAAGTTTVAGTTVGASNDTGGAPLSCSANTAFRPEVFYSLTLASAQDVQLAVTRSPGSALLPAVALTSTCGVSALGSELACGARLGARPIAHDVQPGTYFVTVDDDGFATGAFELTVTTSPPTPAPGNDTCATPATLASNASVMVDANAGAANDRPSCAPTAQGGDLMYTFTTTQEQKVTITAAGMNGADAVLSLRRAPCDSSSAEVACANNDPVAPEKIVENTLPAGTYFVVLKANEATAGQFLLSLTIDPAAVVPTNDHCTTPIVLAPGVPQAIDLTLADYDFLTLCNLRSQPQVFYQFTTTQPQKVTITATSTNGGDASLVVPSNACNQGLLRACIDSQQSAPEVLVMKNLPAGTYSLVVGGNRDGQFLLDLELDAPVVPANDTCAGAEAVNINSSPTRVVADLSGANADFVGSCAGGTPVGGDLFYSVNVAPGASVTVDTRLADSAVQDVFTFVTAPVCGATPDDCARQLYTPYLHVTNPGITAADYFFVVKSPYGEGKIDLDFYPQ